MYFRSRLHFSSPNLDIFERINILINYLSIKTFQEVFKMFLFVTAKIVVSKKKYKLTK